MKKIVLIITVCLLLGYTTAGVHAQFRTDSNTVTTTVGTPPASGDGTVPPAEGGYKQALQDTYGINMNGFDENHLKWTWEKLHEINSPSFTSLLRGSNIEATSGLSEQVGCFSGTTLRLGQYQPEAFFKFILIHELGHIIQSCQPRAQSKYVEHENAFASEGPISYYSGHTEICTGGSNHLQEDYADTLAYYFNPNAGFASGPSACPGIIANPPNPYTVGFSQHKAAAAGL